MGGRVWRRRQGRVSASIFTTPPPDRGHIPDGLRRADRTNWVARGMQPKALCGPGCCGGPCLGPDSPSPAALPARCLGCAPLAAGPPASSVRARGPRSRSTPWSGGLCESSARRLSRLSPA